MPEFHGGCHCGNIDYTLEWPLAGGLVLRRCGCSFCTKQNAVYTAHPEASLAVTAGDVAPLATYEFDTRTARCHFCLRCGVYLFATSVIDGREYVVLNASTLADFVPPDAVKALNFENETLEERLTRRQRTWIANFAFAVARSPSAGSTS
jgi:hypothetical protein